LAGQLAGVATGAGREPGGLGGDEWDSDELAQFVELWEGRGSTVAAVAWDGQLRGAVAVGDAVRASSRQAIAEFERMGIKAVLLTGDNERAARAVAEEVGIHEVISEVLPEDKLAVVSQMQSQGRVVAMVGDGVNDAAALVQADLGIAMGGGSDVAMQASDLTLVRNDLMAAVDSVRLARRTLRTIHGNLFWAFAYNVAMIPLAAFGLLNPLFAGAAMAFSSVFVVGNSLRLRRFQPLPHQ
jgi:Cu+-exporting ATPase